MAAAPSELRERLGNGINAHRQILPNRDAGSQCQLNERDRAAGFVDLGNDGRFCYYWRRLPDRPAANRPVELPRPGPPPNFGPSGVDPVLAGIRDGTKACADGLVALVPAIAHFGFDTTAATWQLLSGDVIQAGNTLGLDRRAGAFLRALGDEFSAPNVRATPYEAANRLARRLCAFGVAPGISSSTVARNLIVKGGAVTANAKLLSGATVDLGNATRPLTLGARRGAGSFGTVYNTSRPGTLLKVIHNPDYLAETIPSQLRSYRLIEGNPEIPVPRIYESSVPGANPQWALIEDIKASPRFPGAKLLTEVPRLDNSMRAAISQLYGNLADQGLVWVDGHAGNVFLFKSPTGAWKAGVVDPDFLFHPQQAAQQAGYVQGKFSSAMQYAQAKGYFQSGQTPVNFMRAMLDYYYPY